MIISRTPFRISFAGGQTDFPTFFEKEFGAVTTTAINKYMYITINKRFDDSIRVSYSQTENVDHIDQIKHPVVREALRLTALTKGIEIASMADIPSKGTGLGSSSSYAVGLLNALAAYKGEHKSAKDLAKEACHIEREILKEAGGFQDQYIAAYGGLKHIQFHGADDVRVESIICKKNVMEELEQNLILLYTGIARQSHGISKEVEKAMEKNAAILTQIKQTAIEMKDALITGDLDKFGNLLHQGWLLKKSVSNTISTTQIDEWYEKGRAAGALGGKLLGAGGGGFLLFSAPKEKHTDIISALPTLRHVPFQLEQQGSRIIYVGD